MKTELKKFARHSSFFCSVCHALALAALLACPPDATWAQGNAVVKLYGCPAGTAQATAEQLRNEFGAIHEVRIAADERTSQVIVQAPAEIQARVAQRLAAPAPPLSRLPADAPANPPAPAAEQTSQPRSIALQHLTADQFEASLWQSLGNRLSAIPSDRAQWKRYRLALASGGSVELTIDSMTRHVQVQGADAACNSCARLVQALDTAGQANGQNTRLIPLEASKPENIKRAINAIRDSAGAAPTRMPMVAMLFQQPGQGNTVAADEDTSRAKTEATFAAEKKKSKGMQAPSKSNVSPKGTAPKGAASMAGAGGARPRVGLNNPVQIELLEGMDVIVVRGNAEDVKVVMDIIEQIEKVSRETEPAIEVLPLQHVDDQAIALVIRQLYDEVYLMRQGNVSITPLGKPNSLLIVGRPENVKTVIELVTKLDQPVDPETQFQLFRLSHATAVTVQFTIQDFYMDRQGLGPIVRATADSRSNALVVQASPRDMAEIAALVERLDTTTSAAVNEMRVIQLEHSPAQDLVNILQSAIGAAVAGGRTTMGMGVAGMPGTPTAAAAGGATQAAQRNAMLRFLTVDAKGRRLVESGIITDVKITADGRTNSLIVSAPSENMELIEALIHQIDNMPAAQAQIKVFTILNGDASSMTDTLRGIFTSSQTTTAGAGAMGASAFGGLGALGGGMQTMVQGSETSLVPLRFSVDARTNSIIATGQMEDLVIVEAILVRLDDSEARHRKSVVFRLKNSPANDVALAINSFLSTERQVQMLTPGSLANPFEQIDKEVVVVAEPVSNSLILSSTPRFFDEIRNLIEQLDARPPMVLIQVLIAEITLGNTDEFGMELGLQDGLLFDRSVLSNIQFLTTTSTPVGQPQVTTQQIISAETAPGYNFNNGLPLGNGASDKSLGNAMQTAGQGLTNFAVGRTNSQLGYGGLLLQASSESVNLLLRALAECHRAEILQRPQIMTLDNQAAYVQIGKRVPTITNSTITATGVTNTVGNQQNVGVILAVTPRISPDGLVVMQIDAERSELEPESQGVPISVTGNTVVRSPITDTTTAQTTVSALSGQTVILGGLIGKTKTEVHRKVPLLGDIPLVGRLFRFDSTNSEKKELLIIMTPHIVRNEADADALKQAEAARMSWCLCDVTKITGECGLRQRTDNWSDAETQVVYPDAKQPLRFVPGSEAKPGTLEPIPAPAGTPAVQPINGQAMPMPNASAGAAAMPPAVPTAAPMMVPGPAGPMLAPSATPTAMPTATAVPGAMPAAMPPVAPGVAPPLATPMLQPPQPSESRNGVAPGNSAIGYQVPARQQYPVYPAYPAYPPASNPGNVQPYVYPQAETARTTSPQAPQYR